MIVTVLRSRLKPGVQDEYDPTAKRMSDRARDVAGYVSHRAFVADDGERVTIVEFETEEALNQWRVDWEHREAKKRGFERFYSKFRYQIFSLLSERAWLAKVRPGETR